jgi:D-alanine-D-alanine ligase
MSAASNGHLRAGHPGALTVVVLAGGRSSEHEVSLSSAQAVREGLLAAGHAVRWIEIGRDGVWRSEGEAIALWPGAGLLGADLAFPVLHGPYGEDGTLQGTLETLALPYVGSGVSASAVSLDKVLFKELARAAGMPQVDFVGVRAARFAAERERVLELIAALGLPVFVKPAHLGSSVGIAKASEPVGVARALEEAFAHDELVIVEAMAPGLEVECAVLETAREDPAGALASALGEISYEGEFYDYSAKYEPGGMQLIVPARISAGAAQRVRELALAAFGAVGAAGLARVDFFVDGERVLVNELNTMPGFTPTSVYAKLIEASGIPYAELVERLCRLALERSRSQRTAGQR